MKKEILFTVLFLTQASIVQANVFERLDNSNRNALREAIDADTRGYYYRSPTDYNFIPEKEDPQISTNSSVSLGCSGFDFRSNFLNQFRLQALGNAATNLSKEIVAASPMLFLEYASPALADLLKHFNNSTNLRLGMLYAQCEDIEEAVGDELDKLRKRSEKECLAAKDGQDLDSAIQECKGQKDPFAFLKDSSGQYLRDGGEINILEMALERISLAQEEKEKILSRLPEKKITASSVETSEAENSIDEAFYKVREENFKKIEEIYSKFNNNPESVSQEELEAVSIPGVQITLSTLNDWRVFKKNDRMLKFAQLSSSLAQYQTINEYEDHIEKLNIALLNPKTESYEREELIDNIRYLKNSISRIEADQLRRDRHARILIDSITEADRRRLEILVDSNSDWRTNKSIRDQERKQLFIPN